MSEKCKNPGAFVKGDPRINRKGRPRDFRCLRILILSVIVLCNKCLRFGGGCYGF